MFIIYIRNNGSIIFSLVILWLTLNLSDSQAPFLADEDGWYSYYYAPAHSSYNPSVPLVAAGSHPQPLLLTRDQRILGLFNKGSSLLKGGFPKKSFGVHVTGGVGFSFGGKKQEQKKEGNNNQHSSYGWGQYGQQSNGWGHYQPPKQGWGSYHSPQYSYAPGWGSYHNYDDDNDNDDEYRSIVESLADDDDDIDEARALPLLARADVPLRDEDEDVDDDEQDSDENDDNEDQDEEEEVEEDDGRSLILLDNIYGDDPGYLYTQNYEDYY